MVLDFITDVDADKSEFIAEPGTTIPLEFAEHLELLQPCNGVGQLHVDLSGLYLGKRPDHSPPFCALCIGAIFIWNNNINNIGELARSSFDALKHFCYLYRKCAGNRHWIRARKFRNNLIPQYHCCLLPGTDAGYGFSGVTWQLDNYS